MTQHTDEYVAHEDPHSEPHPPGAPVIMIVGLVVVAAAIIFIAARALGGAAGGGDDQASVTDGQIVTIEVAPGSSARTIAALLEEEGVVASASVFEREVRRAGVTDQLQAGTHVVTTGMSAEELIGILTTPPPPIESYRLTVIEGLRIEEILASLSDQTPHGSEDFAEALTTLSVSSSLLERSGTDLAHWEGILFPDTYEFAVGATPTEILQRLASTMEARVEAVDWSRLSSLGVTQYEALVIASLVEKEAKIDVDRPLMASAIYNRLDRGMRLEIDATLVYMLGDEFDGRVLNRHKEIDSPYNTYLHAGLPPTPIGAVRLASLEAVADPPATDFLFWVLVDPSGAHGFSATFEEHTRKVAKARADGVLP